MSLEQFNLLSIAEKLKIINFKKSQKDKKVYTKKAIVYD